MAVASLLQRVAELMSPGPPRLLIFRGFDRPAKTATLASAMDQPRRQEFYRWEDGQGRVHIANSLDDVPAAERGRAERLALDGTPSATVPASTGLGSSSSWKPDAPSVALGLVAGLAVALVLKLLPGKLRWVGSLVLFVGVALLLSFVYLGAIRRATGASDNVLATPSPIIQDAKHAVEQMNARQRLQAEELRQVEAEGRGQAQGGRGK
jgi:Domain of unknown function (DUF4124)